MKNFFKKDNLIDILFIFLISLTPLLWFRENTIMAGHDLVFPLNPQEFLYGRLFTWIDMGFGQGQSLIMGTIPTHLIDALPSFLGFSIQNSQKIVYVFWFFLIGLSVYTLAKTINNKSRIFQLTSVVLYQFNFFILQAWWVAERTKFSAYVALPLVLTIFIRVLRGEMSVGRGVAYNTIILFFLNGGGLFGISLFGGFFITIFTFIVFFSLLSILRHELGKIKKIALLTLFTIIFSLIVNSYYLFPAFTSLISQYEQGFMQGGGAAGFINWASEISANAYYMNIFRLQGVSEWYDNVDHPYSKYFLNNPILIFISFVWSFLIFSALLIRRKEAKELIIYFFLTFLLGVFFTAGTHPPLGLIYGFLLENIPGFAAFRSPYFKFAPSVFLAASFLIAFVIDSLSSRFKKVFFICFIILIFVYHFPYFTGEFFSWKKGFSTRLEIPNYVFQFGDWLNQEKNDDGRVLFLPPNSPNWEYSAYSWGYLSYQAVPTLFSNKSVVINNDRLNTEEKKIVNLLYQSIEGNDKVLTEKLLSLLRIQYIVVTEDIVSDIQSPISQDANYYRKILEESLKAAKIRDFEKWDVYKSNTDLSPRFFLIDNIDIVSGAIIDVGKYYDILSRPNVFAIENDLLKEEQTPINSSNKFYVPDCLNCTNKDRPFIVIPERSVLPDSPLYPLVLLYEDLKLNKVNKKSLLYDYLGISLKRAGEAREIFKSYKKPDSAFVNNYILLLEKITSTFNSLTSEEKNDVVDDVDFYLTSEHSVLSELFGVYATDGNSSIVLDRIIQGINSVLEKINPYLLKLDAINNRLYETLVENPGNYNLYLKKEGFASIISDKQKLALTLDDSLRREIDLMSSSNADKWLIFPNIYLSNGKHRFLISYPEPQNVIDELKADTTEFNTRGSSNCFTARVNNFDYKKTYRMKLNYTNDFTNELFFYAWELENNKRDLINAYRLRAGVVDEELLRFIKVDSRKTGLIIALCSSNLNNEVIEKKINLKVNEVIQPNIIIVPENIKTRSITPIEYRRVNPTEFDLVLSNPFEKAVLVFSDRFDNGWEIEGENFHHFKAGLKNAWIIDGAGRVNLKLFYKPQKIFMYTGVISVISLGLVLLYIFFHKNDKTSNK
ncbi:MAG: hypothetical protein HYT07_02580 [Candidatus Levybacteria bacterium]|nr:hypothetical protein [Candidatus Levybacteria bacterium]